MSDVLDKENTDEKLQASSDEEVQTDTVDDEQQDSNDEGDVDKDGESSGDISEESNNEDDDKSEKNLGEDTDDRVVVTIGDEEPQKDARPTPSWVKDLRKSNRRLLKENDELQKKLAQPTGNADLIADPGRKPTMESNDYDSDRFEQSLLNWYDKKNKSDKHENEIKAKHEQEDKAWQYKLNKYNEGKNKLKVLDYEEAELTVNDVLSATQQGMIVEGADDPALVIYALGKNPKKLSEIAQEDPIKFAFVVSKLETQMKISSKRRPTSQPEKTVKSSSAGATGVDATLARLRADADKTGDRTKVLAYKNKLRNNK